MDDDDVYWHKQARVVFGRVRANANHRDVHLSQVLKENGLSQFLNVPVRVAISELRQRLTNPVYLIALEELANAWDQYPQTRECSSVSYDQVTPKDPLVMHIDAFDENTDDEFHRMWMQQRRSYAEWQQLLGYDFGYSVAPCAEDSSKGNCALFEYVIGNMRKLDAAPLDFSKRTLEQWQQVMACYPSSLARQKINVKDHMLLIDFRQVALMYSLANKDWKLFEFFPNEWKSVNVETTENSTAAALKSQHQWSWDRLRDHVFVLKTTRERWADAALFGVTISANQAQEVEMYVYCEEMLLDKFSELKKHTSEKHTIDVWMQLINKLPVVVNDSSKHMTMQEFLPLTNYTATDVAICLHEMSEPTHDAKPHMEVCVDRLLEFQKTKMEPLRAKLYDFLYRLTFLNRALMCFDVDDYVDLFRFDIEALRRYVDHNEINVDTPDFVQVLQGKDDLKKWVAKNIFTQEQLRDLMREAVVDSVKNQQILVPYDWRNRYAEQDSYLRQFIKGPLIPTDDKELQRMIMEKIKAFADNFHFDISRIPQKDALAGKLDKFAYVAHHLRDPPRVVAKNWEFFYATKMSRDDFMFDLMYRDKVTFGSLENPRDWDYFFDLVKQIEPYWFDRLVKNMNMDRRVMLSEIRANAALDSDDVDVILGTASPSAVEAYHQITNFTVFTLQVKESHKQFLNLRDEWMNLLELAKDSFSLDMKRKGWKQMEELRLMDLKKKYDQDFRIKKQNLLVKLSYIFCEEHIPAQGDALQKQAYVLKPNFTVDWIKKVSDEDGIVLAYGPENNQVLHKWNESVKLIKGLNHRETANCARRLFYVGSWKSPHQNIQAILRPDFGFKAFVNSQDWKWTRTPPPEIVKPVVKKPKPYEERFVVVWNPVDKFVVRNVDRLKANDTEVRAVSNTEDLSQMVAAVNEALRDEPFVDATEANRLFDEIAQERASLQGMDFLKLGVDKHGNITTKFDVFADIRWVINGPCLPETLYAVQEALTNIPKKDRLVVAVECAQEVSRYAKQRNTAEALRVIQEHARNVAV